MSPNRQILRLAVPNIISNLSVPLLSAVDTALVGHLPEVYYIGAVAIGGMIFNFVYWGFGFLRMGTTGIAAQAFGQNNESESFSVLMRSMLVALGCGLLLILLQAPIANISFLLIHASEDVETHARIYFNIRIFAAPATLALYAIQGWFLGMQNARYPLYITVLVNAINIIFNFVFVLGFGMNSDGVALGTVIAQYSGLFFSIYLFYKSYAGMRSQFDRNRILEFAALKRFFSINFDIFVRTLLLIFAFAFFTAKSAELGDDLLAANTILMQFWTLFAYGIDGFAFSAESLIGKFTGSGDRKGMREMIRLIFLWGVGLGLLFTLIFFIFGKELVSIFTDKSELVELAMQFFIWTLFAPIVNSVCYIWDGIYLGATASKAMRNSTIVATLLVFLPAHYLVIGPWGNHGMWFAMTLFMVARGVSLSLMANKNIFID